MSIHNRSPLLFDIASTLVLAAGLVSLDRSAARASEAGKNLQQAGCVRCHSTPGDFSPTVSIQGPDHVKPGEIHTYTLTIEEPTAVAVDGGFFLVVDGGALSAADDEVFDKNVNGALTHKRAKRFANGRVTWSFHWTAPLEPGAREMRVDALATNGGRDLEGDNQVSSRRAILVEPVELTAHFTVEPRAEGRAPFRVRFKNSTRGGEPPLSYSWDFGDGSRSTEEDPVHFFLEEGAYEVLLTATDSQGDQSVFGPEVLSVEGSGSSAAFEQCESPVLRWGGPQTDASAARVISVDRSGTVADVHIGLDITHDAIGEVGISLTSPSGTTVQLQTAAGGDHSHARLVYTDQGRENRPPFDCDCPTRPQEPARIATFAKEEMRGDWILELSDDSPAARSGTLNLLCLRIFTEVPPLPAGRPLYAITKQEPPWEVPAVIRHVDPWTGTTLRTIRILLEGEFVFGGTGLAVHPDTGDLYAVLGVTDNGQAGGETAPYGILAIVDPLTGDATSIGRTDPGRKLAALAFARLDEMPEPVLFSLTGKGQSEEKGTLFDVSTDNAELFPFCRLPRGEGGGQALAFNPDDGFLYHAAGDAGTVFERIVDPSLAVADGICETIDIPVPDLAGTGEAESLVYWPEEGVFLWKAANSVSEALYLVGPDGSAQVHSTLDFTNAKQFAFGPPPQEIAPPTISSCGFDPVTGDTEVGFESGQAYDALYVYADGVLVDTRPPSPAGEAGFFSTSTAATRVCVEGLISGVPSRQSCCEIATERPTFIRGDCDGDGSARGITDAVFLLNYNFAGGGEPPCLAACDANGDGRVGGQVVDAVYLLTFSFIGGAAPVPPFPDCGPGLLDTDDELGCETPGSCQ